MYFCDFSYNTILHQLIPPSSIKVSISKRAFHFLFALFVSTICSVFILLLLYSLEFGVVVFPHKQYIILFVHILLKSISRENLPLRNYLTQNFVSLHTTEYHLLSDPLHTDSQVANEYVVWQDRRLSAIVYVPDHIQNKPRCQQILQQKLVGLLLSTGWLLFIWYINVSIIVSLLWKCCVYQPKHYTCINVALNVYSIIKIIYIWYGLLKMLHRLVNKHNYVIFFFNLLWKEVSDKQNLCHIFDCFLMKSYLHASNTCYIQTNMSNNLIVRFGF